MLVSTVLDVFESPEGPIAILDISATCHMPDVLEMPYRAEVVVGDEIVTSGLGGVFPSGLPIGRVSRTDVAPTDGSPRVGVRPAVDFSSIEEVFVVILPADAAVPDPIRAGE